MLGLVEFLSKYIILNFGRVSYKLLSNLKSYVYNDNCELEIVYSVQLLTSQEKIKIVGGILKNFFTPMQLEWTKLY